MKIRDSGMPAEDMWRSFFNPLEILKKLNLDNSVNDVVEFGSGYGTFTIPAASLIKGKLYALDIESEMIRSLREKTNDEGIKNIEVIHTDFVKQKTNFKDNTVDYVMLFNILHAENPVKLLKETYRILRPEGKAGIIHWIHSKTTPRGPSLDIRPTPDDCSRWLKEAGFKIPGKPVNLPPYHYGLTGIKI